MSIYINSQPAEFSGLNLNLLLHAKQYKQQKYDEDVEQEYKLADLANSIKAAPWDRQYKERIINDIHSQLEPIATKLSNGDPTAHRDLMKVRAALSTNRDISTLNYNYEQDLKLQKDQQDYKKDNKYREYNNPLPQYLQDRRELTPFEYQGIDAYKDPREDALAFMNGIQETTLKQGGYKVAYNPDGSLAGYYNKAGEIKGITPDHIEELAKVSAPDFLKTDGGRSLAKELMYEHNITDPQQLQGELSNYLYRAAIKQAHQTGGATDLGFLPKFMVDGDKEKTPSYAIPQTYGGAFDPNLVNQEVTNKLTPNKEFINKKGNIISQYTAKIPLSTSPEAGSIDIGATERVVKNPNFEFQKNYINTILEALPQLKGHSGKDILAKGQEIMKQAPLGAFSSQGLEGMDHEAINKLVVGNKERAGNMANRKVMLSGNSTLNTLDKVAEELGITTDDLEKRISTAEVTGLKPVSLNAPGSWNVNIRDNEGNSHELTINGSNEQTEHFRELNHLLTLELAGKNGEIITNNYLAKTKIFNDNNTPSYGTKVYPLADPQSTQELITHLGGLEKAKQQGFEFKTVDKELRLVKKAEVIDGQTLAKQKTIEWYHSPYMDQYKAKNPTNNYYPEE